MISTKKAEPPQRLGRGLAVLLGGADTLAAATRARGPQKIPIAFLRPNPRNPRQNFADESLEELTASIKEPFDTANEVADRDMRWYLDEHVDMLFGQNARDDLYPQFLADLPNDVRIRSRNVPSRTL